MIQTAIHLEDTAIINMYDSKNSSKIPECKNYRIKMRNRQIHNYSLHFNIPLSLTDRTNGQSVGM